MRRWRTLQEKTTKVLHNAERQNGNALDQKIRVTFRVRKGDLVDIDRPP